MTLGRVDGVVAGAHDRGSLQIISLRHGDGKAMQIDHYSVPAPSLRPTRSVIAAQERRVLQTLLVAREAAASTGGRRKIGDDTLGAIEYESLAVLDRRIAEARAAESSWFEQAAQGNALPRQEFW